MKTNLIFQMNAMDQHVDTISFIYLQLWRSHTVYSLFVHKILRRMVIKANILFLRLH